MNSPQSLYETSYGGSKITVYPRQVVISIFGIQQTIGITQIASIEKGMWGYMQIIIETTGGKRIKVPCVKKKEVEEAIYKAQEALLNSQSSTSSSIADEILKLAQLREQGILSEKEFEEQKKKLLD